MMSRFFRIAFLVGVFSLAASAAAQDQDAGVVAPEHERSTTFRPVSGAVTEDVPGGTLLIAAYGVVWLLVTGYVAFMGTRQVQLRREIERLGRTLPKSEGRR